MRVLMLILAGWALGLGTTVLWSVFVDWRMRSVQKPKSNPFPSAVVWKACPSCGENLKHRLTIDKLRVFCPICGASWDYPR